jgi:hypothetical protein
MNGASLTKLFFAEENGEALRFDHKGIAPLDKSLSYCSVANSKVASEAMNIGRIDTKRISFQPIAAVSGTETAKAEANRPRLPVQACSASTVDHPV